MGRGGGKGSGSGARRREGGDTDTLYPPIGCLLTNGTGKGRLCEARNPSLAYRKTSRCVKRMLQEVSLTKFENVRRAAGICRQIS